MKAENTILIADRNPHVREFLRRELAAADYHIRVAESGKELLRAIYSDMAICLVILDPDFPDTDRQILLRKLRNRLPLIPVILHIYPSDCDHIRLNEIYSLSAVIEKDGSSVEELVRAVAELLENGNMTDRKVSANL